jgi:hypothetical protein
MCEHGQNIAYEIQILKASRWGEVKILFKNCEWRSPIKITQIKKDYK